MQNNTNNNMQNNTNNSMNNNRINTNININTNTNTNTNTKMLVKKENHKTTMVESNRFQHVKTIRLPKDWLHMDLQVINN